MSRQLLRVTFETPLRHLRDATLPTYPCAPRPPQATSSHLSRSSSTPRARRRLVRDTSETPSLPRHHTAGASPPRDESSGGSCSSSHLHA